MKYLSDRQYTLDRIHELTVAVEFARYELAAALDIAKGLGLTWRELGERLGMTPQGAGQFARRQMSLGQIDPAEVERICRLLGIGDKVVRFEVRVITSGRPGITAVKRQTLSRHLRRDVAERRCRERGPDAELWSVQPDGTATKLAIRPDLPQHRRPTSHDGGPVELSSGETF